jgi:uncharacterized protein YjbI with pentapeptide repeats
MPTVIQNQRFTGNETSERRSFEEVVFVDCRFEDYVLEGANLADAVFVGCSFRKVDFYWAYVYRARFIKCELEEVSLRGASMDEVVFVGCRLVRCDFSHDNLGGNTDLSQVTFHDSQQTDCDHTKFKKA